MTRSWMYKDDSGTEYGPYTRAELELYAGQGRISRSGWIGVAGEAWRPAEELWPGDGPGIDPTTAVGEAPVTPPVDREEATRINQQRTEGSFSSFPRIGYILLGIILPLTACGLAGVNNLLVGRNAIGATQLGLSLFGIVLNTVGLITGVTFCAGVPIWLGVLLWSILEAATNQYDGRGRLMR